MVAALPISDDLHGGTFRLFEHLNAAYGIRFSYVDTSDLRLVREAVEERTRGLFVETASNPLMKISDLRGLASLARQYGPHLDKSG